MDMSKMLRDLQKMQSKMMKAQSDLKAQSFEAEAGGGMVKVAMNGKAPALGKPRQLRKVQPEKCRPLL